MQVRIYKPGKTAMQSGMAKTHHWVLEPVSPHRKDPEALMGWVSSRDTLGQIRLQFATAEEALAYAQGRGWTATLLPEHPRQLRPKSYADNFRAPPAKEG